jgi:hypothetical protein
MSTLPESRVYDLIHSRQVGSGRQLRNNPSIESVDVLGVYYMSEEAIPF